MTDIQKIIPETNIIVISPHYDDVPLTFGGLLDQMKEKGLSEKKNVRVINVFSKSNYQARDVAGNNDRSGARVQFATGVRLMEDLACLDDLLGSGKYTHELCGEFECVFRAKPWKSGEKFEFPQGNRTTFDGADSEIFERIKIRAEALLSIKDTAILLPLGVKEHIDHVIVREAFLDAGKILGRAASAHIYFGEDQPYAGLASESDWDKANLLIGLLNLRPIDYCINIDRKAALVMRHYPSQVEESYREGLLARSGQLSQICHMNCGVERIYSCPEFYNKNF